MFRLQTLTGDSAWRQGIRQMLHVRGKLHRDDQQRRSQVGSIVAGAVMQKRLGIQFHGNSLQHRCHRGLFMNECIVAQLCFNKELFPSLVRLGLWECISADVITIDILRRSHFRRPSLRLDRRSLRKNSGSGWMQPDRLCCWWVDTQKALQIKL